MNKKWAAGVAALVVVGAGMGVAVSTGLVKLPGAVAKADAGDKATEGKKDGNKDGNKDGKKPDVPLEFVAREVVQPAMARLPGLVEFSGPLVAPQTALVRAKAGGTLLALTVAEGSRVQAGQTLGRIELAELNTRVAERSANLESIRAALVQAERTHASNERLAQQQFISSIALVKTIALDRHGEDKVDRMAQQIIAFQKYLWSFWSSDKASTKRLDSSVNAHVWYLWKLQGRSYPVIIAGMLIIGSIAVLTQGDISMAQFKPDPRMRLEPIMALWWMTLFAAMLGLGFGMLNPDAVTSVRRKKSVEESLRDFHVLRMGSFQSSLPISNEQISRAILQTIAKGSLISIALSLLTFVVISIVKIDLVSGLWQSSFAGWYWLGLFFLPWAAMGCSATVCLFGRAQLVVAVTATLVGIIVLVAIPTTQAWCMLSLSIASVLAVLAALAIGLRDGQLSTRTVAAAIAGWISLVVLSCLSSPLELTNWILSWLVLLATVAILPIIVMPVAIAFNRHR